MTYKNETSRRQMDYFLLRKHDRLACKDCKIILRESTTTTQDSSFRLEREGKQIKGTLKQGGEFEREKAINN